MKINMRQNVFETNSSSTHSISINKNTNGIYDTIIPDKNGTIILNGGEFGWGYEEYNDPITKANYCAQDIFDTAYQEMLDLEKEKMLIKVIKEHTGAKEVVIEPKGYIDHQSIGTSMGAFKNEQTLKDFIFDRNSFLTIDNDNH